MIEVVGVKYDYDYVVDVDGVKKTYHINLHESTRTQIQTGVHQGQRKCGRRRHESFGLR